MQVSDPITEGQQVIFAGRRYQVAFINYNVTRCVCGDYCRKADLVDGMQAVRECELTPAPVAMVEGQIISKVYDYAEVVLTCVRPGFAYRVSVFSGAAEVDALTRSYPTEVEARTAARGACKLFARGATVQLVLDALEYATAVTNQIAA